MDKPLSSNVIYVDVLDRIINLELEPGSKISENKISEEYNVSRSVIRNVFARLAQNSFLTIYPQRGTYVNKIDLEYIRNALLIRISIEKEMLYRFMKKSDKSDVIEKMEENVKQQEKFYYVKDYTDEFKKLDEQFHEYIILSVEDNNILSLLKEHLLHISRWRNMYVRTGHRVSHLIDEHKRILDCIKADDLKGALVHMSDHIDTGSKVIKLDDKYKKYFS
ncbi:GntR family transcriptional regulator [Peptostreptococcus faecalis]|uniref:GntR family transcriptional regulator n=1 Tax=Peptostreptococcus faecalis TaxID=2045015 RepID=UPI000C7AC0EB|nr:GntR family transcriptional regulator [Peptostreptococcus faecalis]